MLPGRLHELLGATAAPGYAEYSLSVQNVGANPRCVYLPYGLLPGEAPDPEFKDVDDASQRREFCFRTQGIPGAGYDGRGSGFLLFPLFPFRPGAALHESHPELIPDTTGVEGSELESLVPFLPLAGTAFRACLRILSDASEYTDFVYSRYTQLPVELYPVLRSYLERARPAAGIF